MFTTIKTTFKILVNLGSILCSLTTLAYRATVINCTHEPKEALELLQTEAAIAYLKRETRPLDQLSVQELRYLRTQIQRGIPASSNKTNQLHRIDYRIANLS